MATRNLNYWIELAYRRRTRATTVAAAVMSAVVLTTVFWPPVFQSTTEILIQDNRAQYLVSPDLRDDTPNRPTVVTNPVTEEDLNSESEMITSLYLIRQAIEGLPVPPGYSGPGSALLNAMSLLMELPGQSYRVLHDAPQLTPADQWALELAQHLDADVIKRSDIIEVRFRSHDAAWSQKFLSLLLNRYLELHARISHDPEAEKFFQQQAALLQSKLNASERALNDFQLRTGISDFAGEQQALISRLSELKLERSKTAAELASAQAQVAFVTQLEKSTPQRIGKEVRSVQQLKPQVMQLKSERADLLSRYQPTSARIREIDAKLSAAQKILDSENHLEVTEKSTDLNPTWVAIDSNLAQSKTSADALKATQDQLDQEIARNQAQLDYLVSNSTQLDQLQRQVAADKEAYVSYVRKTEEARAAGALNSNKILNVSVAQPPQRPVRSVFPIIWLNLFAGLVLAAALAIAVAELDERRDPRIYSTAAISRDSGLQTLAVLADRG
jgi:uncharacterized protein involved in exopolysaccharide biosynthesis